MLFAAPGNPGIEELATCVPVQPTDLDGLVGLAEREGIDLTVVGPEAPLVAGLVDRLGGRGLRAFGPQAAAARIEGSKAWARRLCRDHGIPSPDYAEFDAMEPVAEYLAARDGPFVVKADGLAAGKGVTVTADPGEALRAAEDCLVRGVFGEAGGRVVIEECLEGVEVSALALVDGTTVVPLALAQDFKRIFDGDGGPNTGGMGAYSPLPFVPASLQEDIVEGILRPTARALHEEGVRYRGVLYAGLMLTDRGSKVLEFNCRFGDPETQVILPRLRSDLSEVLLACAEGRLEDHALDWSDRACVTVVAASGGYPGDVQTGRPIDGLSAAAAMRDVTVFHAGTARREGRVVTSGGRVLAVTALGSNLERARNRAYEAVERISFEGMQFRRDIAAGIPQGVAG
jgi:phosphoribosylamine--glycine ligase